VSLNAETKNTLAIKLNKLPKKLKSKHNFNKTSNHNVHLTKSASAVDATGTLPPESGAHNKSSESNSKPVCWGGTEVLLDAFLDAFEAFLRPN